MNLSNYIDRAISYDEYIDLLGENLSLHKLHYKNFHPDKKYAEKIKQSNALQILCITKPNCSDSIALLPIVKRISEINPQWNFRIILRDDNPDLMDKFLTNGAKAIPIFLFLDKNGELLFKWGPRPQKAQAIFEKYRDKIKSGEIEKSDVILKIRRYYAKDKGKDTSSEIFKLLFSEL
jgi:hypothetical protein